MTQPDSDPEVATGRAAGLAFLASRNPADLAHLWLPAAELQRTGLLVRSYAEVPEAAALTLGGVASWLAHQGNPGFGYGIAMLLAEYWRQQGAPVQRPEGDPLLTEMQRPRGDALVTAAYACNRAGWPQRTLEIAEPWHGRDTAAIGGRPVAVHLELLAAEAHWLLRNIDAARQCMPDKPPAEPGAASLWSVMHHRLDALEQKGRGTEMPLEARWEKVCQQALGQIDQLLTMFPAGSAPGPFGDTHRMLASLRERFLREAALPPQSEPELVRRVGDVTDLLASILGAGAGRSR